MPVIFSIKHMMLGNNELSVKASMIPLFADIVVCFCCCFFVRMISCDFVCVSVFVC